jgi:ribosomal protein L23
MEIKPYLTEKTYKMASADNQYTFIVGKKMSKIAFRKEVESKYGVKVLKVRLVVTPGKQSRNFKTYRLFRKAGLRKYIAVLKDGDKIDEFFNLEDK